MPVVVAASGSAQYSSRSEVARTGSSLLGGVRQSIINARTGSGNPSQNPRTGSIGKPGGKQVQNSKTLMRTMSNRDLRSRTKRKKRVSTEISQNEMEAYYNMVNEFKEEGKKKTTRFVFSPDAIFARREAAIMVVAVLWSAFSVPTSLTFNLEAPPEGFDLGVEIFLEVLFIADIVFSFNLGYTEKESSRVVMHRRKIRWHYFKGWFVPDILSSIPIEIIGKLSGGSDGSGIAILRILRTFKLFRLVKLLRFLDHVDEWANIQQVHLAGCFFAFILLQHWIACGYWYICYLERARGETNPGDVQEWLYEDRLEHAALIDRLACGWYWAMCAILGNDVYPSTTVQRLFTTAVLMVGIFVISCFVGQMSTILLSMSSAAADRQKRTDAMNRYMMTHRIPKPLQLEVKNFNKQYFRSKISCASDGFISALPPNLATKVVVASKRALLESCMLFVHISPQSIVGLAKCLQSTIAMPNELIVRQGEPSTAMFFLVVGIVDVYVESRNRSVKWVAERKAGEYFGEKGLLKQTTRSSSIEARVFCELETLQAEDCIELYSVFPDIQAAMQKKVAKDTQEQNIREKAASAKDFKKINSKMGTLLGFQDDKSKAQIDTGVQKQTKRAEQSSLKARLELLSITTASAASQGDKRMASFRGVVKAKMNQSMSRFHLNTVAPFETDSKQQKELVFRQALAAADTRNDYVQAACAHTSAPTSATSASATTLSPTIHHHLKKQAAAVVARLHGGNTDEQEETGTEKEKGAVDMDEAMKVLQSDGSLAADPLS